MTEQMWHCEDAGLITSKNNSNIIDNACEIYEMLEKFVLRIVLIV